MEVIFITNKFNSHWSFAKPGKYLAKPVKFHCVLEEKSTYSPKNKRKLPPSPQNK